MRQQGYAIRLQCRFNQRYGILVFSQAGELPGKAVEELITKIQALDMDEVRGKVAEARKEYEKAQKDDNAPTDEQPAQSA